VKLYDDLMAATRYAVMMLREANARAPAAIRDAAAHRRKLDGVVTNTPLASRRALRPQVRPVTHFRAPDLDGHDAVAALHPISREAERAGADARYRPDHS
jgi:hypothetical protein